MRIELTNKEAAAHKIIERAQMQAEETARSLEQRAQEIRQHHAEQAAEYMRELCRERGKPEPEGQVRVETEGGAMFYVWDTEE